MINGHCGFCYDGPPCPGIDDAEHEKILASASDWDFDPDSIACDEPVWDWIKDRINPRNKIDYAIVYQWRNKLKSINWKKEGF